MQIFKICSSFLIIGVLSFQSEAQGQEYSFPPFPKSELAYWYDIIESKVKDEQGNHSYTFIYQGVQFHTLFN